MEASTPNPVRLVEALEAELRAAAHFETDDFRDFLLPAAIVGHVPQSVLESSGASPRLLIEQISQACTGLWVERIANRYRVNAAELKALWRLADEDREAAVIGRVRLHADRVAAVARIRRLLTDDYLSAEREYLDRFSHLVSRDNFDALRVGFVRQWIALNELADASQMPDAEQLAAIAHVNGTVLVTARAGSGKTTTLVRRAVFLVRHCRVDPSDILMLAFNRGAATSMRRALLSALAPPDNSGRINFEKVREYVALDDAGIDRLSRKLGVSLPIVLTFHALAYGLVSPEQSLLLDDAEGGNLSLSRVLQDLIDDHMRDPAWREHIRQAMLLHFRQDWEAIANGGYDKAREELLAHRNALPRESLRGEFVKSYGEKVIADFLLEHGVAYRYERNHRWNGFNYRPDFTIFRKTGRDPEGVVIEYFGLKGDADYDELSERKRAYWREKPGWDFLEFSPSDIVGSGVDAFRLRLKDALIRLGIPCRQLSEDEVWESVKRRAIDRFTSAVRGFVSRCRKQFVTPDDLDRRLVSHLPISTGEDAFLVVARRIYEAYLNALDMADSEDFDGLMQRAIEQMSNGDTVVRRGAEVVCEISAIRFLCIDEFQDFSELFHRLLLALRQHTREAHLFCVGDDWQAINGFAGSDLRFFENFDSYIGPATHLKITTNYRSCRAVVEVGNTVMNRCGTPARANAQAIKGSVSIAHLDEFDASILEQQRHQGDDITPAVLRLVRRSIAEGRTVAILSRRNGIPWYVNWATGSVAPTRGLQGFLDHVRSFLLPDQCERVTVSTAHRFKGQERDDVIIIDAVARSYPLVHPDWIFARILGVTLDDLVAEDRRLFYVAVTRARNSLYLVTEPRSESPFLKDVRQQSSDLLWVSYPAPTGIVGHVVLRVENRSGCKIPNEHGGFDQPTYAMRESLKLAGFRFVGSGSKRAWEKVVTSEGFQFDRFIDQAWIREAVGIDITALDESGTIVNRWIPPGVTDGP